MTYDAYWVHLDPTIHVDARGDFRFDAPALDGTRAAEGALLAFVTEQIAAEQHRPVIVTRLVAVA